MEFDVTEGAISIGLKNNHTIVQQKDILKDKQSKAKLLQQLSQVKAKLKQYGQKMKKNQIILLLVRKE